MRKEKGQDIIEYALMLAVVVGIGFGIYSYGGQGIANSISSVFNNAGSLLDSASVPAASSPEDIIKRLEDGRQQGLDILPKRPASVVDIAFDSAEGQALAQKLNIQTKEGDGWYARVNTNGIFVVTYYSAAAEGNHGVTFDQLREGFELDHDKKTQISVAMGQYRSDGTLMHFYSHTTGHVDKSLDGNPDHVEKSSDGSNGMTIYPGPH